MAVSPMYKAAFHASWPVPRNDARNANLCRSGSRQVEFESTCPPHRCDRFIPSPLSCVLLRPAPPVDAHTPPGLPCPGCVQTPSGPTWGTLIRVRRLKHRLNRRHRIPLRPPHSLRGYSCPSPQQSRWLDAQASTLTRHVRGSRPGMVSSPTAGLISGDRIQKRPLTHPG